MNLISFFSEIHPITGAKVESQFRDAFTQRLNVTKQPILNSINADANPGSRLNIKSVEPFSEWLAPGIILADENLTRNGFQLHTQPVAV